MASYQKIYEHFSSNIELQASLTNEQKRTVKVMLVNILWRQMGTENLEDQHKRNELGDIHLQLIESINFKKN